MFKYGVVVVLVELMLPRLGEEEVVLIISRDSTLQNCQII